MKHPSLFPDDSDKFGDAYPSGVPHNGVDTSIEAARSIAPEARTLRMRVHGFISLRGQRGATCEEVERQLGIPHQTASARITELVARDAIYRTGSKRPTSSGRMAGVYLASHEVTE